jgi:hypothetical protein
MKKARMKRTEKIKNEQSLKSSEGTQALKTRPKRKIINPETKKEKQPEPKKVRKNQTG